MVEFRLLGPVEAWLGGRPLDLGTAKRRGVLAALLVDAGRTVDVETLIDRVWDTGAPAQVRSALYAHLSRIRGLLTQVSAAGVPATLDRRSGGYAIDVDPERVDLLRMRRLVDRAATPGVPDEERAGLLRAALDCWRGEPLAGLGGRWMAQVRQGLHQERLTVAVSWAQLELGRGNGAAVTGPLTALAGEYPLVEPLAAALMRALSATGHRSRALDCYAAIRRRLAEELGVDPGAELQRAYRAILRGGDDEPAPVPAGPPPGTVPALLPLDVRGFTGRSDELAQLDALLDAAGRQPTAVVVAAVAGTAGVGKTAFAVHWAHQVRHRFPDGQLYINLCGFDPARPAVEPGEALRAFLEALGSAPPRVPAELPAQVNMYRSLLAGRRVLIIADNARDAEQVRPLLPGAPGCAVVVTSRNQLTGLIAAEGAHPIALDLLSGDEARRLLGNRLGARRVAAEPGAVDEIVERTARLPLALTIVAARAAIQPRVPLAAVRDELRRAQRSLDQFTDEDPAADLRAVLSWSYNALGADAAWLFRLLALHPGPDVTVPAAASLAGLPVAGVRPLLAELARAHLLTEHAPGRYAFHDLLAAYATELVHGKESEAERQAAQRRVFDHYVHTAFAATRLMMPHREPVALDPPARGAVPERLADRTQAVAWFVAENAVVLAAVERAAAAGFASHAWQLAWTVADFLDRQGRWLEIVESQRTALEVAEQYGDVTGQLVAHREIARGYVRLGAHDDSQRHLEHLLRLFAEQDDLPGQAGVHMNLCQVMQARGRSADALDHALRSLTLYRQTGDRSGEAKALNSVGWTYALMGEFEQALAYSQEVLPLFVQQDDATGEAATLHSIGYAQHHLGRYQEAMGAYLRALPIAGGLGDRYHEAVILDHLGDSHHGAGEVAAAREAWRRAMAILNELDHPDAGQIRVKLIEAGAGSG